MEERRSNLPHWHDGGSLKSRTI